MRIRKNLHLFLLLNAFILLGSIGVIVYTTMHSDLNYQNRLILSLPLTVLIVFALLTIMGLLEMTKSRNFFLSYDDLQKEIAAWQKEKELYEKYVKVIGEHEANKMVLKNISYPRATYLFERLKVLTNITTKSITYTSARARILEIEAFAKEFPDIGDTIKELKKAEVKTPKGEIKAEDKEPPFKS